MGKAAMRLRGGMATALLLCFTALAVQNNAEAEALVEEELSGAMDFQKGKGQEVENKVCNGWSPEEGKWAGKGSFCAFWGEKTAWCFVNEDFEGQGKEFKTESTEYPGKFYAPCVRSLEDSERHNKKRQEMEDKEKAKIREAAAERDRKKVAEKKKQQELEEEKKEKADKA